jgi:rhodanese-related sulfurtransferase
MPDRFKKLILTGACLVSALFLSAQAPFRTAPEAQQNHSAEIDPQLLVAAKDALELLKTKTAIFVDVRSRFEYNAEHIQNAVSFPYKAISMTNQFPFPKDKELIMYCGCPHHLSGMSAEILKKQGYSDVKVINEGYWGWKQMGFPIIQGPPEALKRISQAVDGRLVDAQQKPLAYHDVFVEHVPTGQLEATRTDANGNFHMQLHFASVNENEKLVLGLSHKTLARMTLSEMEKPLLLRLPIETALKPQ